MVTVEVEMNVAACLFGDGCSSHKLLKMQGGDGYGYRLPLFLYP